MLLDLWEGERCHGREILSGLLSLEISAEVHRPPDFTDFSCSCCLPLVVGQCQRKNAGLDGLSYTVL